jgi:hypothetical protein
MDHSAFWESSEARRLQEPELVGAVLGSKLSESELFDLTFHARFASNLFTVMKREGSAVQGFERMQQSFRESVEKIRSLLVTALPEKSAMFGELTGEAFNRLIALIHDLALVKEWEVRTLGEHRAGERGAATVS